MHPYDQESISGVLSNRHSRRCTLKFLKRLHVITSDGIVVQPSGDYAAKMCDSLEVPVGKLAKTPCTKELLLPDGSPELSPAKAGKYRSAVEIAMYMW